jgi:hypothetical protein
MDGMDFCVANEDVMEIWGVEEVVLGVCSVCAVFEDTTEVWGVKRGVFELSAIAVPLKDVVAVWVEIVLWDGVFIEDSWLETVFDEPSGREASESLTTSVILLVRSTSHLGWLNDEWIEYCLPERLICC